MSQRWVHYKNLHALTGWDRPLQRFFLVIETDEQNASSKDEYIFDNLARPNPAMTLDEIDTEITKAGMPLPPTLHSDLENDRRNSVGNTVVHYYHNKETGSYHER